MSDNNDTPPENEPEGIKNLRTRAGQADAEAARADAAERRLAFMEAGIPTGTKPAQAFLSTYAGDMTPDAIRAEALEWGLIQPDKGGDQGDPPPRFSEGSAERQQQQLREQLEPGTPAGDEPPAVNAVDTALGNFAKNRKAGMGQTAATNVAFGEVIKAAAMGDKSVIFDPQEWAKKQAEHGHGAEYAR